MSICRDTEPTIKLYYRGKVFKKEEITGLKENFAVWLIH